MMGHKILFYGEIWLIIPVTFSYYKVKECLCDTPSACDQNVQFLHLGQFLSTYKG